MFVEDTCFGKLYSNMVGFFNLLFFSFFSQKMRNIHIIRGNLFISFMFFQKEKLQVFHLFKF